MAMDLDLLRTFTAIARRGTFSAAAHELSLTQSGVSRQVQKLERELGVALFDRSELPLGLTREGELLREYAERVLAEYAELQQRLRAKPGELSGELRVAASTTPGEFLLPRLISAFTAQHPKVQPDVRILDSAEVVGLLERGAYDVGFTGAKGPGGGLRYWEIAEDEVVLAVPARHPFARRDAVRLEDLPGQPFIAREGGSGTLRSVHEAVAAAGLKFPELRIVMVLGSHEAIVEAVRAGLGLGFVSALALAGRSRQEVRAVRLDGVPVVRPLYLAHPADGPGSPLPRAFIDFVLQRRGGFAPPPPTTRWRQ